MANTEATVDDYVLRIQKTRNAQDLLKLLAQFRQGEWTDLERQKVSHTYMRMLNTILKASAASIKKTVDPPADAGAPANDGPVWYEKM